MLFSSADAFQTFSFRNTIRMSNNLYPNHAGRPFSLAWSGSELMAQIFIRGHKQVKSQLLIQNQAFGRMYGVALCLKKLSLLAGTGVRKNISVSPIKINYCGYQKSFINMLNKVKTFPYISPRYLYGFYMLLQPFCFTSILNMFNIMLEWFL